MTTCDIYKNFTFKFELLKKVVHLINIVSTLYLISRNLDFVFHDV